MPEMLGEKTFERVPASTKNKVRRELKDVTELEIVGREGVLAAERHGGDEASGDIGRVQGVLLRRRREQGVDLK